MPIISSTRDNLFGFAHYEDNECHVITNNVLHLFVSNHNTEYTSKAEPEQPRFQLSNSNLPPKQQRTEGEV